MKRLLALALAGAMVLSLPVMAAESPSAAVVASDSSSSDDSNSGYSSADEANAAAEGKSVEEYANNAVISVPNLPEQLPTAQGGHIVINGAPSNYRFILTKPTKAEVELGKQIAALANGKVLSIVGTKSNLKTFDTAVVNFYMKGVADTAKVACFEIVDGQIIAVPVLQVYKDHVIVVMGQHGKLVFVQLP